MSNKDDATILALLEPNRAWLFSYVLSAIGDPVAAEDVVQDVMLVAIRNIGKYDSSSPLGAWLRGIARNLIYTYWRTKGRMPLLASDEAIDALNRIAEEREGLMCDDDYVSRRIAILRKCMYLLTRQTRNLVEMKYFQNLKSLEIAARTQKQVKAIDVALFRARNMLFECVRRKMQEVRP